MRVSAVIIFFFQAEDGIRDLVRSRGLGDVYKRQRWRCANCQAPLYLTCLQQRPTPAQSMLDRGESYCCLLYTSDAADERSSVDLGGRRIIKKNTYV